MSQRDDLEAPRQAGDDFRDIVLKSGFSGVAATVLVVTVCSPAGVGGMIGTSVAASLGFGAKPADSTLHFPRTPAPLSSAELQTIHDKLANANAQIADIRAATDTEIQHMRDIAGTTGVTLAAHIPVMPAPVDVLAHRIALAAPATTRVASASPVASSTPVAERVISSAPSGASSAFLPADESEPYDPHLELAALFFPVDADNGAL